MKTKIFYILFPAVLSLSTLSVFAVGTNGKKESASKKNTAVSFVINTVKDAEMEIESWMTSVSEFNNKSEVFVDDPLELGPMMMNELNINNNTKNFQENELILEDWMLESFDVKTQEVFTDEELAFEPWMFEIL